MTSSRWCCSIYISIALCTHFANTATESGVSTTASPGPTNAEPFSSPTPTAPPGGTEAADSTSLWTTDPSEAPTEPTEPTDGPPAATVQECVCDLTPGFCDIGCCCDTVDCGVANLTTVFTECPQKVAISGVCIEKWLMFQANVDSSLITVTDSLFCVRSQDKTPQALQALSQYPALGDSYRFLAPEPTSIRHGRPFYRVDDVIKTYFSSSSVRGLLRQPSPGVASALCISRNPAKFLRSVSMSCTRMLTPESCTTDPTLMADSYFSDLNLIKIPVGEKAEVSDFLIPVTPLSEWPGPSKQNSSCVNVVKKVEYIIGYTGRGELTYATVNIILADVDPNEFLSQTHSVQFQLATPRPTPEGLTHDLGLIVGFPVIGRFDGNVTALTTLSVSPSGECSSDSSRRMPILFTYNAITGCKFRSPSSDCSELQSQIYGILQGLATPDEIAMNSGYQMHWARVITQSCPVSLEETCESGCTLPISLSIQVLWAHQGLLDFPQSFILGAKYLFKCKKIKCPVSSPLALTTSVTFADATLYPEPPRGLPQADWKFPFGFFTRGTAELDGHIIVNSSDTEKVTLSLMFTVMLLTGLEFFTM
ncbi:tectonic-3 [Echeneis naucrates]|uniref:Uncharacterized protein n=1 Tax=Echeneis naucrates TaxID=173247 RepID=A0A665UFI9_ECHNA|nr:tectonic-3 [Echeneis naucrates]